jgi:putative ABC transport system permease protein
MQTLWQDLRYGVRMLFKKPGFTLVAVITLALGIGANTAIFTVVNAALLRGLPYRDSERLVHLWETTPRKDFSQHEASYPDFLDWRENKVFEGVAAYAGGSGMTLTGRGTPERVPATLVSANFFSVLGVEAMRGRAFRPEEDQASAAPTVMLSYGLWQRLFGADPNIIGQSLTLDGRPYNVIGILPPSFQFALRGDSELWAAYEPTQAAAQLSQLTSRGPHGTKVIARLKPGVSFEQAQAEMHAVGRRIEQQHPDSHTGTTVILVPLQEQIVGAIKPVLLVLLGAVGFVLLIACANVANLLLARASARRKEVAIRAALGASRWRLMRQMLTESMLLALVGGAAGLLIAQWGVAVLVAAIPEFQLNTMPYLRGLSLDRGMLAFTGLLSLLTGLVFGLAPAWQASKLELQTVLKEGGRTAAGATRHRLRDVLVVTEIALALVLLVGAGLMMRSVWRLLEVNPGFRTENLLTMRISLPAAKYQAAAKAENFYRQLDSRLEALPGVKGSGLVSRVPLQGGFTTAFYPAGQPVPPRGQEIEGNLRYVSSGYFQTMGVPLIKGRYFTDQDNPTAPAALIVNQTLARRLFPNQAAVGQQLVFVDRPTIQIVGVVGDEKVNGLDAKITPVVYFPFLQGANSQGPNTTATLMVRTASDPTNLAAAIQRESRTLESDLSIFAVSTMEQLITNAPSTFRRRYPAFLISIFAAVALVLASVGIYGLLSYSISQRTQEIGVRVALGAQASDVLRLVIGRGMRLTLIGVAVGLAGAYALTRWIENLLFEVKPTDPVTFGAVAVLLTLVALLACWIPARRATQVDPMVALRQE